MKRKIALALVLVLISSCTVYAAAVNGNFVGLPIVKVKINGETLSSDVPGVVLQGRTVLPVRAIAEGLGAIVSWDAATMTASIVKPSVSMVFVEDIVVENDGTWTLINSGCSNYSLGRDQQAYIYFTVGPMTKQLYTYRILVKDTAGIVQKTSDTNEVVFDEGGIMGGVFIEGIDFVKPGKYPFEFQIKQGDRFVTVATVYGIAE